MRIASLPGSVWCYITGSWLIPAAAGVILLLGVRDALLPEVPLWVGFVEFPLFLGALFGPFVDGARREGRWHAARGWIWNANEPRYRGWWASQFGFLVTQLRRPAWWAPMAFKLTVLLTVARVVPEAVRYVALLPLWLAIGALASILATRWRAQPSWDRVVPAGDLPPWAQRRVDRWPLTAAAVGFVVVAANVAMAVYFFALDAWPMELLCSVQCFWLAVTSLRRLSPAAAWRQLGTEPMLLTGRAA